MTACDDCLRRAWLLGRMAGHIERGPRRGSLLAMPDDELIAALGGDAQPKLRAGHAAFAPRRAREVVAAAELSTRCEHGPVFPQRLTELDDVPAAIFIAGQTEAFDALARAEDDVPAVAVVGARRCAGEGEEVAHALGHGLAAAGVCVISGLALGIDSAAHHGALSAPRAAPARAGAPTVAVLAGGADVVYPASGRALYRQILVDGCAISELPPGTRPQKWTFPARNRIIAALAGMTVVVQARERSGSLITADLAMQLGRTVGAVPGPVTRALSRGTNALLHDGAHLIRDARDVIEALLPGQLTLTAPDAQEHRLEPDLELVLTAVEEGATTPGAISAACAIPVASAAGTLTRLELLGLVRRDPAGRYARTAGPGRAVL